jgi:hypothetical protein
MNNNLQLLSYIEKFSFSNEGDAFKELYAVGVAEKQLEACDAFLQTKIGQEYIMGDRFIKDYIDQYDFDKPIHLITFIGDLYGDGEVFGPLDEFMKTVARR